MFHYITSLFGLHSLFRTFQVIRAFAVGRVKFLISLRVRYQGLSAKQWFIARLVLDYFAVSSASDAAPSSLFLDFSNPVILAHSLLPVRTYVVGLVAVSHSLCARLMGF